MVDVMRVKQGDEHWPDVADMFPSAVGWATDPAEGGDYHFFVAVAEDGDAVGGSVIEIGTLRFGPLADMPVGYLEDILALEDHRRKGVGTALLRATLNHAWEHGCENVRWTVTYDNLPALALYRSMGLGFIPDEDPSQTEPERQYTVVAINPTRAEQEYGASRQ